MESIGTEDEGSNSALGCLGASLMRTLMIIDPMYDKASASETKTNYNDNHPTHVPEPEAHSPPLEQSHPPVHAN